MAIKDLVPLFGKKRQPERQVVESATDAWSPYQEVDRLFDDFFRDVGVTSLFPRLDRDERSSFLPTVDMAETDKDVTLSVELPGMEEKDFHVDVEDEHVVISGEKREEHEDKQRQWHYREQRYGRFQRVIALPPGTKPDEATARFRKGTLTVTVPKDPAKAVARHRINVMSD
jgi:HSP20 family protein